MSLAVGEGGPRRPRNIQILESVVGSFRLDSVLPTEGGIVDSYHEIWVESHLNFWRAQIGYLRHCMQPNLLYIFFQNIREELVIKVSVHILHALNSIGYNLRPSHRRHVCNYTLTYDTGAITNPLCTKQPQFLSSLPHIILTRLPKLTKVLQFCYFTSTFALTSLPPHPYARPPYCYQ